MMYDKELVESVCNLTCDFDSLNRDHTKIKYDDTVDAFDKYYNFDLVVEVMELYKCGKITDRNLANWMCIYDWIINGGFGNGYEERYDCELSIKEIAEWEISDWLDALSFFAWNDDHLPELTKAKRKMKILDRIIKTPADYNEVYAYKDDSCGNDDSVFLVKSESRKKYILLKTEIEFDDIKSSCHIKAVEKSKFDSIVYELKAAGYKK